MKKNVFALLLVSMFFAGCGSVAPHRIDPEGNQGLTTVNELNFKDWQMGASKCINSLLQSGVLDKSDGTKAILMISTIKNSTLQHVNVHQLTKDIRIALLRSGKAITTTAVSAGGAEDKATRQVRELRDDEMFNQRTVKKMGTAIAPDFSLSGEILQQRTVQGRTEESYFEIQLSLTDLNTGLAVWEDKKRIAKQGTRPALGF